MQPNSGIPLRAVHSPTWASWPRTLNLGNSFPSRLGSNREQLHVHYHYYRPLVDPGCGNYPPGNCHSDTRSQIGNSLAGRLRSPLAKTQPPLYCTDFEKAPTAPGGRVVPRLRLRPCLLARRRCPGGGRSGLRRRWLHARLAYSAALALGGNRWPTGIRTLGECPTCRPVVSVPPPGK